jgi:DNA-binding response OmpR family regulator
MVLLATARPKVLLIELHNDGGALGSILESVDLEVLPAASVEAAQHLVDEGELDLVLLDLPPHASDGLVVCERLREVTDGSLPIICIAEARGSAGGVLRGCRRLPAQAHRAERAAGARRQAHRERARLA